MSTPPDSRRAGGVVLFTNGDTPFAQTRTPQCLGACVVLKCIPLPQVVDLTEKLRRTRARLEEEVRKSRWPWTTRTRARMRRACRSASSTETSTRLAFGWARTVGYG
jgi:hypothetical protein